MGSNNDKNSVVFNSQSFLPLTGKHTTPMSKSNRALNPSSITSQAPFFKAEGWNVAASDYDLAVGRCSRIAADRLITMADSLRPLDAVGQTSIELGAGTGSLTHLLRRRFDQLPILATDIAPNMLEVLRTTGSGNPVDTQVLDMADPITSKTAEGTFTHVFCSMALQTLPEPVLAVEQWKRLLVPGGIMAVGIWDFDEPCGPHAIWQEAAQMVDPAYVNPPILQAGRWTGLKQLEVGLRAADLVDVRSESCQCGFDVGSEGFMHFFWESRNPMPVERQLSFGDGDLEQVRVAMASVLKEKYDEGRSIPLFTGLAVGRKRG